MNLSLSILETNSAISKMILDALRIELDRTMQKSAKELPLKIKPLLSDALKQEPEYSSLKSGKLRFEFGIPDAGAVDDVVEKIANTITINASPLKISGSSLSGGFTLTAIKTDDINGIINDPSAIVEDTTRGHSLPWLEWLLFRGNQTIVKGYDVKLGPNDNSRTGNAIMVSANNNWRVPAEFAGTSSNNWTTRAVERLESNIYKIIQSTVESNI
jgi:hypothetical protein